VIRNLPYSAACAWIARAVRGHHIQRCIAPSLAWTTGLLCACVGAQTPPQDSAQIQIQQQNQLRQQEREHQQREQLEREPDVRLPRDSAQGVERPDGAEPDTPCFAIRTLSLHGQDADRFAFALQAVPGHEQWTTQPACLGVRGIGRILRQVQNALVERGYVTTRIFAEPQDLTSGELRLTVIPGRIRAVQLDDGATHRGTLRNALPTGPGQLLDLRDIEQALENLKRVPSADADIQIVPGDKPGDSDLQIQWRQGRPWRLAASLDDAGSRSTGRIQGSLTLSYDHWWTLNDLFYLTLNSSVGGHALPQGTDGHTVHYSLPWGYWLASATVSHSDYHQSVAGSGQTYLYSGTNDTAEIKLSRNLYRDGGRKTGAYLLAWRRRSNNFIDDTEVEVQRRRMAGWEAGLTHREAFGPHTLEAEFAYRRGTGADRSLLAPEESFGEGSSRPGLIKASAQLGGPLNLAGQRLRYSTRWQAQWNRTPLVPQDRFSIGSRYTVRGFDGESTLVAERGWWLRNEISWTLADDGPELYAGLDHGEVGGASAELLSGTRLSGAVVGLRGTQHGLGYDLFASTPLRKPEHFRTGHLNAGFSLNWSY
jgi:hemolysin activation/secretion protein